MLEALKDSTADWQKIDSKEKLLDSASNGCVDSLSTFLKLLTFHGESTTPYIRRISANPNNNFTKKTIEPIEEEAIQYVHQNIINPFDVDTFPHKKLLNEESLKGHIDYDQKGILYIRSPQMTEKTQSLKELMELIPKSWGVILIGHRKSLLRSTAKQLGLELYLDINETAKGVDKYEYSKLKQTQRLAITWHSLFKLANTVRLNDNIVIPTFNVVIFDESEQVFSDFYNADRDLSHAEKLTVDKLLNTQVYHSDLTVCLDADISNITRQAMKDYKSGKEFLYLNNCPIFRGYNFTYLTEKNLWLTLHEELSNGETLFITTEHKGHHYSDYPCSESIHHYLKQEGFEGISINRENTYDFREIITEPNKHIPELIKGTSPLCKEYGITKLEYLATTPTLQTGWSCGTHGEKHSFTRTFGVFPGRPSKHYTVHSIRQAVRRARCVKEHYLYISQKDKAPREISKIIDYLNTKGKWIEKAMIEREIDIEKAMSQQKKTPFDSRYMDAIQHEEYCQTNRYLHSQLLFKEYKGNVNIDMSNPDFEEHEIDKDTRMLMKKENIQAVIDAEEITTEEYREIASIATEPNKMMKRKYKIRQAFDYFGKDKEDTDDRPLIDKHAVKRWRNGDIKRCYDLRQIASQISTERSLIDFQKAEADRKHDVAIGFILDSFYEALNIPNHQVFDKPERMVLFEEHIPDDTIEYLTEPLIIEALNFTTAFGESNTAEMGALNFFSRVARALDLGSKLYQPNDEKLRERYIEKYDLVGSNVAHELRLLCIDEAKRRGLLKGIYKPMAKRKFVENYLDEELMGIFEKKLLMKNLPSLRYGLAYLRYTRKHLSLWNFNTYPLGLFPDLAQFDIRGEEHRSSSQLNQENIPEIEMIFDITDTDSGIETDLLR